MNKYYTINYSLLVLLLTPTMLRNPIERVLLSSLVKPLDLLNEEFSAYAQSLDTQINAQICYMQALLNDEFDFFNRRIIVRTIPLETDNYLLWSEASDKPMMLSNEQPVLLNSDGQLGSNTEDFEVVLPQLWVMSAAEETRMRQIINANKLASKKYIIVYE